MGKRNLILLHGALGSHMQLTDLANCLKDSFHVYSFNFEGHGGRKITQDFSIELFVQNTQDFMLEQKLDHAYFFGYSMGGYVALKLATLQPKLIKGIVTYGTKFDWTIACAEKEVKMLNPTIIEEKVPHFANEQCLLHNPEDWKEVMHKTAAMMLKLGENPSLSKRELQSVTIPVGIGIGKLDHMVSILESEELVQSLPNGKLHVFDSFPHALEKTDLQTLSDLIRNLI